MKKLIIMMAILCTLIVFAAGCSGEQVTGRDIDVDLTRLSDTMAAAEFHNIITNSADYKNKTIKAAGPYFNMFYNETGLYYHFVTIVDGDACCRQGFEFRLSGDPVFPDDFPDENTVIELIGTLGSYEESGNQYFYLAVDEITLFS